MATSRSQPTGVDAGGDPRPAPAVTYWLAYNAPDDRVAGLGPGWTLLAEHAHGPRWSWSVRLDGRGAGPRAGPRQAQAVAVRVLADLGVTVHGWSARETSAPPASYRAETVAGPDREHVPLLPARQVRGH